MVVLAVLSVCAALVLMGVFHCVMWGGNKALKLRPIHRFKQWRKRRNARAVVKLRAENKHLRSIIKTISTSNDEFEKELEKEVTRCHLALSRARNTIDNELSR